MALLLASCLAGLLLCEAGLRLFHPKYKHLAEAAFIRDPNLLFVRLPNHRSIGRHPETHARHLIFHNNFGLRQHRNFSAADLESSVNIGFFGDSFTENYTMEAPFSFTEPLDYLLNIGGGGVNVLNFGVSGYGTSQSLLRYEMQGFQTALDHVFYVYCNNDLAENLSSGLFRLDDAGQLAREEAAPSGRFALLSKLNLSYLALDAAGRLSTHLAEIKAEAKWLARGRQQRVDKYKAQGIPGSALALFQQLLRRWKKAVEKNGASFHLVWLPMKNQDAPKIAAIIEEEGIETLSLHDCFGEHDPAHLRTPWSRSPYRFEDDWHWNEAGNRLAAICLHRFLEGALGLPRLSEEDVELALRRYYSAFEAPAAGEREGDAPRMKRQAAGEREGDAPRMKRQAAGEREGNAPRMKRQAAGEHEGDAPRMKTESRPASPQAAAIRRKYNALEGNWTGLRAPWTPSPDKLAIRSRFNVYLHDGWLAYVKEGCKPADFDARFFLHVFPADVRDLRPHKQKLGFENLDFWQEANEAACSAWKKLPGYAIERIRTGQFSVDDSGSYENLWQGEHVFSPEG